MLRALSGTTTMQADLPTDIQVARLAGFSLLELSASKLQKFLQSGTAAELAQMLETAQVRPLSIVSVEGITYAGDQWERVEREYRQLARLAGEIGCEVLVASPGARPVGVTDGEVKEESVSVLEALADIASAVGVKLGFEFLSDPSCSVRTLEQAWGIISELDRPDVGLVLDTFHFHAGGSSWVSLRRMEAAKLLIFQVSDCDNLPRAELQNEHRLLPGAGSLPLGRIWQELNAIGYDRLASVEVPRPEYWKRDPQELATEARQALETALGLKK